MIYRALVRAKCKSTTWYTNDGIAIGRLLKNIPFRILCIFMSKEKMVAEYETAAKKYNNRNTQYYYDNGHDVYEKNIIPVDIYNDYVSLKFEDTSFQAPIEYEQYLQFVFGDYMKLPPESERENRHMIEKVDLGVN